jgi:mRNA interferase MazF
MKLGLCVVCPTTNQAKGYPFEVELPAGFTVTGVILTDHVKSLSWQARGSQFIAKGPPDECADARAKVKALLLIP